MARFGRRTFRRMKVSIGTKRGSAISGKRAKVFIRKPTISSARIKR